MPDITIFNPRKKPSANASDPVVVAIVATYLAAIAGGIFLLIHLAGL